jgi:hypothetical protein
VGAAASSSLTVSICLPLGPGRSKQVVEALGEGEAVGSRDPQCDENATGDLDHLVEIDRRTRHLVTQMSLRTARQVADIIKHLAPDSYVEPTYAYYM